MGWVTDWSAQAACRTTDPDELFVQGAAQNRAKAVCTGCPVRTECLADALDNRVEFGVWGGMTERERRALLRRRPLVTSWRRLLETARSEYERSCGPLVAGAEELDFEEMEAEDAGGVTVGPADRRYTVDTGDRPYAAGPGDRRYAAVG
ncbi:MULTISPECIES: WhiB family transcriptional regulator [unclassified Streptomyces]|uniref:WhiB family transcriptional regulator n=1 Tax=Streptomyces sp. SID8380 TaxID=2690360 RepID=UPI000BACD195|nr:MULTISPECIES: WhiB family transcriptional regulator [unclassified Streptomyces]ASY33614.1 WhiB family transcriptional regulator [Streptomyces sp. CLI2509]MYX24709.1 WhiB family transcriptional regulator [Streptomyces sp. SID8380]